MAWSMNEETDLNKTGSIITKSPSLSFTGGSETQEQSGSSFGSKSATSSETQMGEQDIAALRTLIAQLMGGGTSEQHTEAAKLEQTRQLIKELLGSYTTGAAMTDSQAAMAFNLQKAMEQNMPAIQRAIEGAGTSANAMQGLLSQKLATDSSMAAGALGAEQAKAYANTTANLIASLASLQDPSKTDTITKDLLAAFNVLKGAVVNRNASETSSASNRSSTSIDRSGYTYTPESIQTITPLAQPVASAPMAIASKPAGWWDQDAYNKRYGGNTDLGTISGSNAGDMLSILKRYG